MMAFVSSVLQFYFWFRFTSSVYAANDTEKITAEGRYLYVTFSDVFTALILTILFAVICTFTVCSCACLCGFWFPQQRSMMTGVGWIRRQITNNGRLTDIQESCWTTRHLKLRSARRTTKENDIKFFDFSYYY